MTKPVIYDQFDAAFRHVTAKAIMYNGKHVANVSLKYGSRVYAYVHFIGSEMVRGFAGGGGYDKASAAVFEAIDKLKSSPVGKYEGETLRTDPQRGFEAFTSVENHDSGADWDRCLRDAGFEIINVIG